MKCQSRCRNVGYMSCVPCETKFIIAIRNDEVEEQLPVRDDARAGTRPKSRSRVRSQTSDSLTCEPHEQREQRRQAADEEHRPPAPAREDEEVADAPRAGSRARSLPAGSPEKHAAPMRRHLLHRQRRADAPLAAHADAEQRAQDQERGVGGREPGRDLDDRVEDEIDHQRHAPAVAVGQQAEDAARRPAGTPASA